jgi:hypothetical protein
MNSAAALMTPHNAEGKNHFGRGVGSLEEH